MTMQRAKKALAQNQLVRKMSREGNPEVHYKFFNEVYDALAEIMNEELAWKEKFRKVFLWAEIAAEYIEEDGPTVHGQDMLDRLALIEREVEE